MCAVEGSGSSLFHCCFLLQSVMSQWTMTVSWFVIPQPFLNGCGHGACGAHSTWSPGMHLWSTSTSCRRSSCIDLAPDPPSSHRKCNSPLQNHAEIVITNNFIPTTRQARDTHYATIHIIYTALRT
jgi:hypothetical protein